MTWYKGSVFWILFVSENTEVPSAQVFVIGIALTFCTSQLWCGLAMFFAACRILAPIMSACSWGYFFGFLFYFSLFVTNAINEVEDGLFRTFFTFGIIGNVQLAKNSWNGTKVDFPYSCNASVWICCRACKCGRNQEPEGPWQVKEDFH